VSYEPVASAARAIALVADLLGAPHLGRMQQPRDRKHRLRRLFELRYEATCPAVGHDHVVRVRLPCLLQLTVLFNRLRGRLAPENASSAVILNNTIFVVLLGTIGRGDEVDDAVVPLVDVLVSDPADWPAGERHIELLQATRPLVLRHEHAAVAQAAVEDHDRWAAGAAGKVAVAALELQLQFEDVLLEGEPVQQAIRRPSAGLQQAIER